MSSLVECNKLTHSYGEKTVLHDLTFSIDSGGVFGLLGKNGAGKSTTINILMGYLRPSSGTCRILGEDSHVLTPETRAQVGLLHEGFIQYDFMSIAELEKYHGPFYPKWDRDIFYDLVGRLNVPHTRRLSQLSCGQRSQVVLGLIMAQQPSLMLLDDYSMGLDVGYRRLFVDFLLDYVADRGTTVLLTSHVVQELDTLIDNMIVIKEGRVMVTGEKKDFAENFNCFEFERTEASDNLSADTLKSVSTKTCGDVMFSSVEHSSKKTTVYGFFDESALKPYLNTRGISCNELSKKDMSFEDAFVGLTGKY